MHETTKHSPTSSPLKISLLYLLFGMLWIFFSDRIAAGLTASQEQLHTISNIKGWLFIVGTALLLYLVLRRNDRQTNLHLQKLADNELLLTRSQSLAHIGSWQLDLKSNRLIWTEESYRIFGVSPETFNGTYEAFLETVHPDDRDKLNEAYTRSIRDGRDAYELEHRVVWPDGTVHHIYEKCLHERNADGEIIRSSGFCHDITERRKAKDALRKNDEMMRNSQSVAHICAYSTDLNVNEVGKSAWTCSPEFYKIFGIDETYPHTIDGWANFIHPDFREELAAYHESVIKEKTTFDHEYKIIRINDGAERWVHGTGELVFGQQGTPIRMHGAIQDITERKRMEEELVNHRIHLEEKVEERTRELRTIVNAMAGREVRMAELKESISALRTQLLEAGIEPTVEDPGLGEEGTA